MFVFSETEAVSEDELPDAGGNGRKKKEQKSGDESKKGESQKRKLAEGEYDPSSPTSENSQDEVPSKKIALGDSKSAASKPSLSVRFF